MVPFENKIGALLNQEMFDEDIYQPYEALGARGLASFDEFKTGKAKV